MKWSVEPYGEHSRLKFHPETDDDRRTLFWVHYMLKQIGGLGYRLEDADLDSDGVLSYAVLQELSEIVYESTRIRDEIRRLRCDRKLTQKKLAENLGVSNGYISQIETGRSGISQTLARKLEHYFGLETGYFDKFTKRSHEAGI